MLPVLISGIGMRDAFFRDLDFQVVGPGEQNVSPPALVVGKIQWNRQNERIVTVRIGENQFRIVP